MLRKLCLLSSLLLAFAVATLAQESRHFIFHYDFTVKNLPPGKKIRIWIPAAQSDAYQEVKVVSLHGSMPLERARESRFGSKIYYADTLRAASSALRLDSE